MKRDTEEITWLTAEEYQRMIDVCNRPPSPTPALIKAVKRYKELFKDETKTSEDS